LFLKLIVQNVKGGLCKWDIYSDRMNAMADDVGVSSNKKVTVSRLIFLLNMHLQFLLCFEYVLNVCFYEMISLNAAVFEFVNR